MGRARRTKRGEEGRESRKRLERERDRDRERREEKTEATTVGKIRKWQEMGSCEQGADWLPLTAPQLRLPFPSTTWPPSPAFTQLAGKHCRDFFRRGEPRQRRQEEGKLGSGRGGYPSAPGQAAPSGQRPTRGGQGRLEAGVERPVLSTRASQREMTPSPTLGPALGAFLIIYTG